MNFDISWMNAAEEREYERMQAPGATCWYCEKQHCCLTHKYSPRDKAVRPNDNPYKFVKRENMSPPPSPQTNS